MRRDIVFNKTTIGPLIKNKERKTPNGVIIEMISEPSLAPAQLMENNIDDLFGLINGFQQQNAQNINDE